MIFWTEKYTCLGLTNWTLVLRLRQKCWNISLCFWISPSGTKSFTFNSWSLRIICRRRLSFLCQWVNYGGNFQNFLTCLLPKNATGSVLAVAGLLGGLQISGRHFFQSILTPLLLEFQCSVPWCQEVSPTSIQILALREIENLSSDRTAERSNTFEYNCDGTLFSIHETEKILPYTFTCLSCTINIPPATRTYKWLYKLLFPC